MAGASREDATAVTIFGRTYHLRGDGDAGYLAELAAEVDRRMRDVAEATGTADTLKVAILAALNVTDEYLRARRSTDLPEDVRDRLARISNLLGDALAETGERPSGVAGGRTE